MAIINHSRTFISNVPASTTEWDDFVIPNNKTIRITKCSCHADHSGETNVAVVWDRSGTPEVLALSYGDIVDRIVEKTVTGNGVKKLSIRLQNNTMTSRYLMGVIEAIEET